MIKVVFQYHTKAIKVLDATDTFTHIVIDDFINKECRENDYRVHTITITTLGIVYVVFEKKEIINV